MTEELLKYFDGDEMAANVWLSKYAQPGDITPDDMHRRMAKEFGLVERNYQKREKRDKKLSKYGQKRKDLTEPSIYELFKDFKYIVPQGSVMAQLGANSIGSLSNCFVVGQPEDSYGGIFWKDQELAQLMKRRGGVGIDISTLRPEGTATSNAARSSTGAVSFMHRFSNTTREVAQNGRRGALMISMDVSHPDVMEFIKMKRDLTQVTGANISLKLSDEFMEAVQKKSLFQLRWDGTKVKYTKDVDANEVWHEIITSAHGVAEPGLMFWDNMVNYSPDGVYEQYCPVTTNPCSEIGMQPYDACRLIAVNLFSFVDDPFTKKAKFNLGKFYEINYEAMRLSDDLIDLEVKHIHNIINKIQNDPESTRTKEVELRLWDRILTTANASRRTGLGFTGLGDTLAALGFKYDSPPGMVIIRQVMQTKMLSELDCTTDLAIQRGTFKDWDSSLEKNDFYTFLKEEFPDAYKRMRTHGRRNVSWSTVAPTGTVSIMTRTTSGIEPLFLPFYIRRKKVNPGEKGVRVDYVDPSGDSWTEFPVLHPKFKDWILYISGFWETLDGISEEELQSLFEESPWYESTANDIDWKKRVQIQGIIQKYITHSISSTINLPSDVAVDEVKDIYMSSWENNLKGITVYRDGCRSGVLVSGSTVNSGNHIPNDAPKRPRELDAELQTTTVKGEKFNVIVGLMDGHPYEVFGLNHDKEDGKPREGKLVKIKRGKYNFESQAGDIEVTAEMTPEEETITRLLSTGLRHGAKIEFIVEQLNKTSGDMTSFSKAIARVLKRYIVDGTKSTLSCSECESKNVIFEEGCSKCLDCGSSKCG